MSITRAVRAGLGAVAALVLVGVGVSAASAVDTITPDQYFGGTFYLASAADGTDFTPTTVPWGDGTSAQVIAEVALGDNASNFPTPTGAETVRVFLSPRGQESNPAAWNAYADQGAAPVAGVSLPNVSPTNLIAAGTGTPAGALAVKAAGGDYSLGFAFLKTNGKYVVDHGAYFIHVHITAGTGAFTYTQVSGGSTPTPTASASGSATQNLQAQVAAPAVVDGLLSMIAPASSTTTIGNATIVGGLSTSTGSLGQFTVADGRAASKPGWTLTTTSVGDFVNGSTTIPKAQLGLAPKIVSGTATPGSTQVAGSAIYPSLFAELPAGAAGSTVLDGDLTFVAPSGSPAGTYTSTLTVTLVSK